LQRDIAEFDRQIARNNRRAIWEGIIGFVLCALGIMLASAISSWKWFEPDIVRIEQICINGDVFRI
jgi:hypothetical protein